MPAVEPSRLAAEVEALRSENARLLALLPLTRAEAKPPGPSQTGWFEASPGPVTHASSEDAKVAFFAALFAARTDVYALRWDNDRSGTGGWLPAIRGRWRKGMRAADRQYLPLTREVVEAHLRGREHLGLYPLLDGDACWWLAADVDGPAAVLDALAYVKAARGARVPVALEVSRSGIGAHVWVFFTQPVPAQQARRLGAGLLREAMAVRGRMELSATTDSSRLRTSCRPVASATSSRLRCRAGFAATARRSSSTWRRRSRTPTSGRTCRRCRG